MSPAEHAVREFLLEDASVAGYLGDRIVPEPFDQAGQVPAMTYRRARTKVDQTLEGPSGLEHAATVVNVFAETEAAAREAYSAVKKRLEDQARTGRYFVRQGVNVMLVQVGTDQGIYDESVQKHRVSAELLIHYGEA